MIGPRLPPWLFPSLGRGPDDVIVAAHDEPAPREDFEPLHPSLAYYLVNEWLASAETRERLEALWAQHTGEPVQLQSASAVIARIIASIEEGQLVLWGPIRSGPTAPAVFPTGVPRPTGDRTETRTTWVEIELSTDGGAPVADEPYRITTPDGDRRSGRLDQRGFARLEGLTAGTCDITFPAIDGREWGRSLPPSPPPGADATSHVHEAREEEDLSTIAAVYRFRHWETVSLHPENAALRAARNPDVLHPGDAVAIPARVEREEHGSTGQRHRFLVRTASRCIRIVLLDYDRAPLAHAPYSLFSNGAIVAEDSTDASGTLERPIPAEATVLVLDCPIGAFTLRVGALNPLDDVKDQGVSGAQARLNNLGYHAGPVDGVLGSETQAALRRFQHDQGVETNGKLDDRTKALLKAAHGC